MPIDPEDEVPLYVQLADLLRDQIDRGEIRPRRPIPSKRSLIEEFGISAGTVERALSVLKDQGYLKTVMGKGLFVTDPHERPHAAGG